MLEGKLIIIPALGYSNRPVELGWLRSLCLTSQCGNNNELEREEWSSQYIFQLKQLERRSLKKNQGFNGIRTPDLHDTGTMLYELSYDATHWKRGRFIEFLHFHLKPQYKYELFHINFTSFHCTGRYEINKWACPPAWRILYHAPIVCCKRFIESLRS